MPSSPRVRKNILNLTKDEKDTLIRAFKGIQTVPAGKDADVFFELAGLHGQPFRGPGYGNKTWWGGYCHHGNVLFPTWHRAYLLALEDALRKIPGCENLALPYWDEMCGEGKGDSERVIPEIFTNKTYVLDGKEIHNPLYSYKFAKGFVDRLSRPDVDYSKPKGYETVRFPYSGLRSKKDGPRADLHNSTINNLSEAQVIELLNKNVRKYLNGWTMDDGQYVPGQRHKYVDTLDAPNYTVFSNTTSAMKWNDDHVHDNAQDAAVALESPHNAIHVAVGGYDLPDEPSKDFEGANGDMGENDTAAFDPIFFFHHCFIDRVFWAWETKPGNKVEIIKEYPGTSPVDMQGPTPGIMAGDWLTLDTPLHPFPYKSAELIHTKVPYRYDDANIVCPSHVDRTPVEDASTHHVRISGIDRSSIAGSFVISAWAEHPDGTKTLVGYEPVLSRWHVGGCANCNNHLKVTAYIPLRGFTQDFVDAATFGSRICTRDNRRGQDLDNEVHLTDVVRR
ncbi:hypothetical protein F4861DRAFT_374615 [Xylaria intraflava]|nr:hypothetical protein F4861DRAFT_374615 [Xylaria intraflava]